MTITLQEIARKHKEWIKIAIYQGASKDDADDIVQTMYLRLGEMEIKEGGLHRITNVNGQINTVYVFRILGNLVVDTSKKNKEEIGYNETYENFVAEIPNEEEEAYQELVEKVKNSIYEMHPYTQMLLELHLVHNMSMRQIEKKTEIPTHSIFNTIKNAKQKIKKQTGSEYQRFIEERNLGETNHGDGGRSGKNNDSDWD
jgi:RNA polymerase sigma factor (sigma-70 family)